MWDEIKELNRNKFIMDLVKLLLFLGIGATINSIWVALEYAFYGQAQPSYADTFIWIALTVSLYFNLMRYIRFGGNK